MSFGKGALLWLIGIPLPIIFCSRLFGAEGPRFKEDAMRLVSCAMAVVVAAALAGCVSYSSTTRTVPAPAPATTVVTTPPPPPPPPVVYVPSD